jgi:hypothetical protein
MKGFDYLETADGFQITSGSGPVAHLNKVDGWTIRQVEQLVRILDQTRDLVPVLV